MLSLAPTGKNPKTLSGEHGLSLLVESQGKRILFDSGASPLIMRNAEALRVDHALANLDAIVLSHGHYDHTGGLEEVLKKSNHPVPICLRPGLFGYKVRKSKPEKASGKRGQVNLLSRMMLTRSQNPIYRDGYLG